MIRDASHLIVSLPDLTFFLQAPLKHLYLLYLLRYLPCLLILLSPLDHSLHVSDKHLCDELRLDFIDDTRVALEFPDHPQLHRVLDSHCHTPTHDDFVFILITI